MQQVTRARPLVAVRGLPDRRRSRREIPCAPTAPSRRSNARSRWRLRSAAGPSRYHADGTDQLAAQVRATAASVADGSSDRATTAPNTVRRAFDPLRVVMRRAVQRGWIGANPCAGLELPTGMVKPRERVLDPSEIAEMIEALTDIRDRALWAAAFHAGMRFGELRALRWEHVDLPASRLHVRESMDDKKAITAPKTKAGVRTLPITLHLRKPLLALRAERRRRPFGLRVRRCEGPAVRELQHDAQGTHAVARGRTRPRHTARGAPRLITIWAQAIANPKRVAIARRAASITMTLDRYGKHMALGTDEAAAEVTRFLEQHGGQVRCSRKLKTRPTKGPGGLTPPIVSASAGSDHSDETARSPSPRPPRELPRTRPAVTSGWIR